MIIIPSESKKHIQAYLGDDKFKKVMTVIRNIQARRLIEGDRCSIGDAMLEMAINYDNGAYIGKSEHIIVPYYYNETQLKNLVNLVNMAKRNVANVKQTELERVIPEILELENDKAMLSLVDRIQNRGTLIDIYADYINGHLTNKIKKHIKKNKEE